MFAITFRTRWKIQGVLGANACLFRTVKWNQPRINEESIRSRPGRINRPAKPRLNKLSPTSKITSRILVTGTLQIPLGLGRASLARCSRTVSWMMHSYLDIASVSRSVYSTGISRRYRRPFALSFFSKHSARMGINFSNGRWRPALREREKE